MAALQGRRGGATYGGAALVAGALVLLCVLLPGTTAAKTTYVVGDAAGWAKGVEATWLGGKTFYAGDVLVFKYDKERHDLSVVGAKGYDRCQLPKNSTHSWVLRTGNDAVTLRQGNNYFICSQPMHCKNGMKLHVKAL